MLEECWMKVYIICACHSTCFIQYPSPYMLSFCLKSNMVRDMLLPVILSELLESDAGKPHQSKTREWIKWRHQLLSFQKIIKKPSKPFTIVLMLLLGWYGFAKSHNVKSTLKQRCVCQHWNLQHWMSNQRCLFQRRY